MASKVKVFISYAREDEETAIRLYHDFKGAGLDPWLDKESLLPGQKWKAAISQAIKDSSFFLALLSSKSLTKRGYIQREWRMGFEVLDTIPRTEIFLIPVRLDDCKPEDEALKDPHWADLFPSYEVGLERILHVLLKDSAGKAPELQEQKGEAISPAGEACEALHSNAAPIPELSRGVFEYPEEFITRINACEPVPAGKAKLIAEKYDILAGKFPLEASWENWTRELQGMPFSGANLHLSADRELAQTLYRKGTEHALFIKLKAEGDRVGMERIELWAAGRPIPVEGIGTEPAAEKPWAEPITGMEFIWVPGGKFLMGSPESEEGRFDDEGPVHEVAVNGFWLGKHPVTQREWEKVMETKPSHFKGSERCPVERVSWEDAHQFIQKLISLSGEARRFRLPSEAEWEYACRAGTRTRFYTGDAEADLDQCGWYIENSNGEPHPVGEKEPNAFGLYDMHGNVWEWVEDEWHENYEGAPDGGRAWVDNQVASIRVVRGGCWDDDARSCRSASRDGYVPWFRDGYLGFRVALSLPGR